MEREDGQKLQVPDSIRRSHHSEYQTDKDTGNEFSSYILKGKTTFTQFTHRAHLFSVWGWGIYIFVI